MTNDDHYLTFSEKEMIFTTRLVSSGISTLGISFIVITYCFALINQKMERRRSIISKSQSSSNSSAEKANKIKFSHNIILLISFSDLLCCIASFVELKPYDDKNQNTFSNGCIAQAFLLNVSEISTICLTTGLSVAIYYTTVHRKHFNTVNKYFIWIIIYGFVPALIFSILPFPFSPDWVLNLYGQAGPWCWINTHQNKLLGIIYSMLIFCFNWINMFINIFIILKTIYFFKNSQKDEELEDNSNSNSLKLFFLFLLIFPSILVICWFFPTINRLYEIITDKENFLYSLCTAFFMSIMGLVNSIVYFLMYFKDYYTACCNNSEAIEQKIKEANLLDVDNKKLSIQDDEDVSN